MAETVFSQVFEMDRIMFYVNFEKILSDDNIEKIKEKLNEITGNNKEIAENQMFDDNIFGKNNKTENNNKIENLKTLIDKSVSYLEKNNINEAKLITEIVFSHILNIDRIILKKASTLPAHPDQGARMAEVSSRKTGLYG